MSSVTVYSLAFFDHSGKRKKGDTFQVSHRDAIKLQSKGLVRIVPGKPQGKDASTSASPAVRVSRAKTAKKSGSGGKKARQKPAES